jgi:hypothetical protein
MSLLASRLPALCLASVALLGVACANSVRSADEATRDPAPAAQDPAAAAAEEENAPPHALGTIVLGEQHSAADGISTPIISAAFLPDAKLAKACNRKVAGCEVTQIPRCTTGGTVGCPSGEACSFDDICQPRCVKACTKACGAGEECFFSTSAPDATGMECKKSTRFDAGAIAFSGTTQAISLFPPYAVRPEGNGAPFVPGSEIKVVATGAKEAGFARFEEKFKATTFLETNPSLRKLSRATVFGSGSIPVAWEPGEDTVVVTVSGGGGVATCKADDKAGKLELQRAVVEAAIGDSTTSSSGLSIAVSRERKEVRKSSKTVGSLPGQPMQAVGWLELVTRSSEVASFTSCGAGTGVAACGELCVNTLSDPKNCGTCGRTCLPSQYCSSGVCR